MLKNGEFILTEFFLFLAVDGSHSEDTIIFVGQISKDSFISFAFRVQLIEEDKPNFTSSEELSQTTQVNLVDLRLIEERRSLLTTLTSAASSTEVEVETTASSAASVEEL